MSAFCTPSVVSPSRPSQNVAVATSSEAEDERPPPRGTLPATATSKAGMEWPLAMYCATTPRR